MASLPASVIISDKVLNAFIGYFHDSSMDTAMMPTDYAAINANGIIRGRADQHNPSNGHTSAGHSAHVFTLVGAGLSDTGPQVDTFGDAHVFWVVGCSSELLAGYIIGRGALHTYRISEDSNNVIRSYGRSNY